MVAAEPSTPRRRIVPLVVEHAYGGAFDPDGVRTAPDLVLVAWHPSALLRAPQERQSALFADWLDDLAAPVPEALALRLPVALAAAGPTAAG